MVPCEDKGDAFAVARVFYAGASSSIAQSKRPRTNSQDYEPKGAILAMAVLQLRREVLRTVLLWQKRGPGAEVRPGRAKPYRPEPHRRRHGDEQQAMNGVSSQMTKSVFHTAFAMHSRTL